MACHVATTLLATDEMLCEFVWAGFAGRFLEHLDKSALYRLALGDLVAHVPVRCSGPADY